MEKLARLCGGGNHCLLPLRPATILFPLPLIREIKANVKLPHPSIMTCGMNQLKLGHCEIATFLSLYGFMFDELRKPGKLIIEYDLGNRISCHREYVRCRNSHEMRYLLHGIERSGKVLIN